MSKESMMRYAETLLSRSKFLRNNCDSLEEYNDPKSPLPISLLGYFGKQTARQFRAIDPQEWTVLSALIEQGLAGEDNDVRTALMTGFIEGLVHGAEALEGTWPRIEASLGPLARRYADAYRGADFSISA